MGDELETTFRGDHFQNAYSQRLPMQLTCEHCLLQIASEIGITESSWEDVPLPFWNITVKPYFYHIKLTTMRQSPSALYHRRCQWPHL